MNETLSKLLEPHRRRLDQGGAPLMDPNGRWIHVEAVLRLCKARIEFEELALESARRLALLRRVHTEVTSILGHYSISPALRELIRLCIEEAQP
jgi:hypothetical protein